MRRKLAVIISNRCFSMHDWPAIQRHEGVRRIAILGDRELKAASREALDAMHAVYYVPESDRIGILPILDLPAVEAILENELRDFDREDVALLCADEGNLDLVASLREKLGIRGARSELSHRLRDKVLMKSFVARAGLRVPRNGDLGEAEFLRDLPGCFARIAREVGLPFVAKPKDSAGSDGVVIVHDEASFRKLEKTIGRFAYQWEEFIDGQLYHCDTYLRDGAPVFHEACLYSCGNYDFQLGLNLGSIPLREGDPVRERLLAFALAALHALGVEDGPTHMELFINSRDELVFLEVGGRVPGLQIVPLYEKQLGINLLNLDFECQLGLPLTARPRPSEKSYFYLIFPTQEGVLRGYDLPQEPGVSMTYAWKASKGTALKACESNVDQAGHVFGEGADYRALATSFRKWTRHRFLEVDPS